MKLLIDQLATLVPEHIQVVEELQKKHDILYWIRMEDVAPMDKSRFPKTVFHNYQDALKGIPPKGIGISAFRNLTAEEITTLSPWESEFMTMADKWCPEWPVSRRKDFYYELLRYWNGILDTFVPDGIVFNAVPHQMFNLVLYALAKQRGIRTLVFDIVLSGERLLLMEDYREGNKRLASWKQNESLFLSESMRAYYERLSKMSEPAPFGMREFRRTYRKWRILWWRWRPSVVWKFVQDGTFLERAIRRFGRMIRINAKQEYEKLQSAPDLTVPYVYVPLHYQPEATTSPQGGLFVGQTLAIRMLAEALPRGWRIYVKEHPAQWRAHLGDYSPQRYQGFYSQIAALPNVQFVPVDTSTFLLTDHACAVATISGTAAWEAVVRGKCALVFGYPWFKHAPGIFRVSSANDSKDAFAKISSGSRPSENDIVKFLSALEQISLKGYLDPGVRKIAPYTPEESVQEITRAIEHALAQ
jgi:hypothetical protein